MMLSHNDLVLYNECNLHAGREITNYKTAEYQHTEDKIEVDRFETYFVQTESTWRLNAVD